jgi:hypothetical protein
MRYQLTDCEWGVIGNGAVKIPCFSPHPYRSRLGYEKLAANYLAFIQLASIRLSLRHDEFAT